jgi:hypothetical protein
MGNTFGKHDLESGDLIYRANERLNYRDHSQALCPKIIR